MIVVNISLLSLSSLNDKLLGSFLQQKLFKVQSNSDYSCIELNSIFVVLPKISGTK